MLKRLAVLSAISSAVRFAAFAPQHFDEMWRMGRLVDLGRQYALRRDLVLLVSHCWVSLAGISPCRAPKRPLFLAMTLILVIASWGVNLFAPMRFWAFFILDPTWSACGVPRQSRRVITPSARVLVSGGR